MPSINVKQTHGSHGGAGHYFRPPGQSRLMNRWFRKQISACMHDSARSGTPSLPPERMEKSGFLPRRKVVPPICRCPYIRETGCLHPFMAGVPAKQAAPPPVPAQVHRNPEIHEKKTGPSRKSLLHAKPNYLPTLALPRSGQPVTAPTPTLSPLLASSPFPAVSCSSYMTIFSIAAPVCHVNPCISPPAVL